MTYHFGNKKSISKIGGAWKYKTKEQVGEIFYSKQITRGFLT